MTDKYKAKGQIFFRLGPDGIETQRYDRDYYLQQYAGYFHPNDVEFIVNHKFDTELTQNIYNIFDGKEFLNHVQDGYIMDDDGQIANIFVNGYISNLGLSTDNLTQGEFLVSAEVWKDICNEFKVEVNWANK